MGRPARTTVMRGDYTTIDALKQLLRTVRSRVGELHGRAGDCSSPLAAACEITLDRMSLLVDAVLRLAEHPAVPEAIGLLARALYESMVRLHYLVQNPDRRVEQWVGKYQQDLRKVMRSDWFQDMSWPPELLAELERAHHAHRQARQRERDYRAGRSRLPRSERAAYDHDQGAELPTVKAMAEAIGTAETYPIYVWESFAVHGAPMAASGGSSFLAVNALTVPRRLEMVLGGAFVCYKETVALIARMRGLPELLADLPNALPEST